MQENYTDSAKAVLRLAQKSAKICGHSYVGSEHLLTGLVQETKGTAGVILRAHQVDAEKLKTLIAQLIAPDTEIQMESREGWTPRAQSILKDSVETALFFESRSTGTEHILLGLIKQKDSLAGTVLEAFHVDENKVLEKCLTKTICSLQREIHPWRFFICRRFYHTH